MRALNLFKQASSKQKASLRRIRAGALKPVFDTIGQISGRRQPGKFLEPLEGCWTCLDFSWEFFTSAGGEFKCVGLDKTDLSNDFPHDWF